MIAIDQILADMRVAMQSDAFPDEASIASPLGLDLSAATVTKTDNGLVSIVGAWLNASDVGVVAALSPNRALDLVFMKPSVAIRPYLSESLEANQSVEPSKHGPGISVAFSRDGFVCGVTASGKDGVIETLFCTVSE